MFLPQANRFRFGLKILVQSKAILIWSGNCLGQNRTFLYNPKTYRSKQNVLIWSTYYRNESKMFWFGPLIVGTKAKQLGFARVPLTMLLIYLKFGKSALNSFFFSQISTPRITDAGSWRLSISVMRGVDGSAYIRWVFQEVFRRGRGCLHILSFFLSADRR